MTVTERTYTRREVGVGLLSTMTVVGVSALGIDKCFAKMIDATANVSSHLSVAGRVNLGSFYTPAKYVNLVAEWLKNVGVDAEWQIADLSCGYGAFFELADISGLSQCKYFGNDIDRQAVAKAREMFPYVHFTELNALVDVSRGRFGIDDEHKLVIVGNPPYNDITSQINQGIKDDGVAMDADVKTRDLGMSSLLAYEKLKADYVAVLHPLSYLIKKANFNAAKRFFLNYTLIEHVVFSSQEFAGTSKTSGFPVVVALYKRVGDGNGITYSKACKLTFRTMEGAAFSVDGFDYVTDYIKKYPHNERYEPEILFYTMRDINALKRSRTFIKNRIDNAVDVDPKMLAYYCYVDCFKRYANIPYWLGNFNVPFIKNEFDEIKEIVVRDAKFHNQDVFGSQQQLTLDDEQKIRDYINRAIGN